MFLTKEQATSILDKLAAKKSVSFKAVTRALVLHRETPIDMLRDDLAFVNVCERLYQFSDPILLQQGDIAYYEHAQPGYTNCGIVYVAPSGDLRNVPIDLAIGVMRAAASFIARNETAMHIVPQYVKDFAALQSPKTFEIVQAIAAINRYTLWYEIGACAHFADALRDYLPPRGLDYGAFKAGVRSAERGVTEALTIAIARGYGARPQERGQG
jgi:hypothetical protein